MRGEFVASLTALERARGFFSRKGDRRMEALACLKLSSVYHNTGEMASSARLAEEGLELVPDDARATKLRLQGNIAITSTWVTDGLDAVAQVCKRIAAEALTAGWEHFAAIAFHNLGTVQRFMGLLDHSVSNLERATKYWGNSAANPFADNAELALSLLTIGNTRAAERAAERGVSSTRSWPRPQALARYALANVRVHQGRFQQAREILEDLLTSPNTLGSLAEEVVSALVEVLHLMNAKQEEWRQPLAIFENVRRDPRFEPMAAPSLAFVKHDTTRCAGGCQRALAPLKTWEVKGAVLTTIVGRVKTTPLALEHQIPEAGRHAITWLERADANNVLPYLRVWLRTYQPHIDLLAKEQRGLPILKRLLQLDPEFWRGPIAKVLPSVSPQDRSPLLKALVAVGDRTTFTALTDVVGADVAAARRSLIHRQAPRLFIRTFGGLTVERIGGRSSVRNIDKRRLRSLLGLIVTQRGQPLTRDVVLETMWPDAAPGPAINNLNQAVFQLRRAIDESYREGESPQYLVSTGETLHLDRDLVTTDLDEFRSIAGNLRDPASKVESETLAARAVDLVRGAFLSDLRYEDWVAPIEASVHAEVRQVLLVLAQDMVPTPDLAIRAAAALIKLDEFDEAAVLAMAKALSESGRRAAAREVIVRFARHLHEELDEPLSDELAAIINSSPLPSQAIETYLTATETPLS
jgi:DNA-binding SARP family transcriptional activator